MSNRTRIYSYIGERRDNNDPEAYSFYPMDFAFTDDPQVISYSFGDNETFTEEEMVHEERESIAKTRIVTDTKRLWYTLWYKKVKTERVQHYSEYTGKVITYAGFRLRHGHLCYEYLTEVTDVMEAP